MSSTDDKARATQFRFLADGAERLADAIRETVLPRVRATVDEEYAGRLVAAGFFRKMWLRRCMRAEIKRRVEQKIEASLPPSDTLY